MSALIHIIRHGRTDANERRLYCGSTDISLSEDGTREILALKGKGIYPEAELYISSGMKRSVETSDLYTATLTALLWRACGSTILEILKCTVIMNWKAYVTTRNG